ncbi:hypothetical protein [uncultured Oscillibacter sp.]|uniref:hypothetical protein n=1 Tax=uncultured Oscillibacter sp. TaxID=876091 RepID=UPI0025FF2D21|nr:hypothetical protein [uncultured Oscillibacter sp.]
MKEFFSTLLLAVVSAAVPVLTAYAVGYIRQAGKRAQASTDDIKVQGYLKEITDAISDAVEATSQTYVDALKKAGSFTAEAQAEAAKRALTACIASISPAANAFIKSAYGDLEKYLANRIEAEVRKQKKEEPATLALPVLESAVPDTKAIAATCAAATAAAVTQVAINQPATGQAPAPEQQNE